MHLKRHPRPGSIEAQLIEFKRAIDNYSKELIATPMRDFGTIMRVNQKIRETQEVVDRIEAKLEEQSKDLCD